MAWPDLGQVCLPSWHHVRDGSPYLGIVVHCELAEMTLRSSRPFAAFAHFLLSSRSIAFQIKVHRKPEQFLICPPPKKLEHQNQSYQQ